MATNTMNLGGLPIHLPAPPHPPLSARLLDEAEHAKAHEDQIQNLTASLNTAISAIHKTQEAKKVVDGDLAQWMTYAGAIEKERDDAKQLNGKLVAEKQQLQEEIERLETTSAPLREEKAAVDQQLSGALNTVTELTRQLGETRAHSEVKEAEVKELKEEAVDGRLRNAVLEGNVKKFEQEAVDRQTSNFNLRNELDDLQEQGEEPVRKLEVAATEIDELRSQLAEAMEAGEKLQAEHSERKRELDALFELAMSRQSTVKDLEAAQQQVLADKATLEQSLTDIRAASTELQDQLREAGKKLTAKTTEKTELELELVASSAEVVALQSNLDTANDARAKLESEKTSAERRLTDGDLTLIEMTLSKNNLEASNKNLTIANDRLTTCNAKLTTSNEELKARHSLLQSAADESKQTHAELTTQFEKQTEAVTKLSTQLSACKKENNAVHLLRQTVDDDLKAEQSVSAGLKGENAALQTKLQEKDTTIENLQADVQREKASAEALKLCLAKIHALGAEYQQSAAMTLTPMKTTKVPPLVLDNNKSNNNNNSVKDETPTQNKQLPPPVTPPANFGRAGMMITPRKMSDGASPAVSINLAALAKAAPLQGEKQAGFGSPLSRDPRVHSRKTSLPSGKRGSEHVASGASEAQEVKRQRCGKA